MRTLKQRSKKYLGIFWTNSFLYAPKKTSFPKYYFGMPKKFFRIQNIANILERLQYFGTILKCELWQNFWTFLQLLQTISHCPLQNLQKMWEKYNSLWLCLYLWILCPDFNRCRSQFQSSPIASFETHKCS